MHTYICLYRGFILVSGRFCPWGFVRGFFVWRVLHNRKLNITFNFRFYMHEHFFKCDVTCSWTPPPCHKLSHLLGPPPPRAWPTLWTAHGTKCNEIPWHETSQKRSESVASWKICSVCICSQPKLNNPVQIQSCFKLCQPWQDPKGRSLQQIGILCVKIKHSLSIKFKWCSRNMEHGKFNHSANVQ